MARCNAKTKKGTRCKANCVKGTRYCMFHQKKKTTRRGGASFRKGKKRRY